ncbi:hypothetical protein J3Q64DRAFT_1616294, partial [Phycomyces blakesleeanus]
DMFSTDKELTQIEPEDCAGSIYSSFTESKKVYLITVDHAALSTKPADNLAL